MTTPTLDVLKRVADCLSRGAAPVAEAHCPDGGVLDRRPDHSKALGALRAAWGAGYRIGWNPDDRWWCERRDGRGSRITGSAPGDLAERMTCDQREHPISTDDM